MAYVRRLTMSKKPVKASAKKSVASTSKKTAARGAAPKKDAKAFLDLLHKDKTLQDHLRSGWDRAIKVAKKKGYKFTDQELLDHMVKRYQIKKPPESSDPDTCTICLK